MYKLLLIATLLIPIRSAAIDYDVEWPTSDEKGIHLLVITINGCSTKFKVKDEDLSAFSENDKALDQAVDKSYERSNSGCH